MQSRLKSSRQRAAVGTLAAGLSLALVAACGSGDADAGDSETHLQFFLSGDANQGGGYAHMAEKYQEETGVHVEIVDIAYEDLETRLRNAAQADDLPPLARIGAIDPVWRNATLDLAEIADAANVRMDLSAVDEDGRVLSLPSDVTAVGMFINSSLFDEAGVDYPTDAADIWTWDEFVDTVEEVQDETGASYGMVMDRTSHRLKAFLFSFGSQYFQADADGQFQADAATREALEYFEDLNDDEFMPRSVWLSDDDPNALFKSGDVVAYMSGSWQIADFAVNIADFDWESVYLPAQEVRAPNYGHAASVVAFDGTGQEEESLAFLEWLYSPENYQELSEISGFLPAVEGIEVNYSDNAEAFELYNEEIDAAAPIVGEIIQNDLAYQVAGLGTDGDPVRDETIRYLNGEQDVDTTIQNINDQLTSQLGPLPGE